MSGNAISSSGYPSDTSLLVDACIARVREAARLDDDAVLPPLPRVAPRRNVVIFKKGATPAGAARSVAATGVLGKDVEVGDRRVDAARRKGAKTARWALGACALVVVVFGTAAFTSSPLGHRPGVEHIRRGAQMYASDARAVVLAKLGEFVR